MIKPMPQTPIEYSRFSNHSWQSVNSGIITEAGVQLTVNGQPWLTFMCTPSQIEALAVGFLYNEGIIRSMDDIEIIRPCETGDNIDVWLNKPVEKPAQWRRTSGCTGGMTSDAANKHTRRLVSDDRIAIDLVLGWMDHLLDTQELYREVRGVHCSIMTDGYKILAQAEDIGRHNTLDKIAGLVVMDRVLPGFRMIVTTGRISSEMLQKAARLGVTVLVSRTSPTSMSISLAEEAGITLIGYARRNQANIYTHLERVMIPEEVSGEMIRSAVHTPAD